jgi:hypothetical protein
VKEKSECILNGVIYVYIKFSSPQKNAWLVEICCFSSLLLLSFFSISYFYLLHFFILKFILRIFLI